MIDLHNHILSGLDDGAADIDESLAIARQFVSEGVVRIAATPHFNSLNPEPPVEASEIRARVSELCAALREQGIELDVVPGQEIFLPPDLPTLLAEGTAQTLGGSRTVLVEIPFDRKPLYFDATIFRLQSNGYRIILAHPERYAFVRRDPDQAVEIADRGVLLQLTAPALLGEYGHGVKRTAEKILRAGAYSLASSDRHHPGARRSLAAVRRRISAIGGEALAELLLTGNPARVLADEPVVAAEPIASQGRFPWPFGT